MGVTYGIHCATCGALGPEAGDFGFIGYPSLQPGRKRRILTFGEIYGPLKALGIVTEETAAINAFLVAHDGHAFDMHGDGIDWTPAGEPGEGIRFEYTGPALPAKYVISCAKCEEEFESPHDFFVPFEPFRLAAPDISQAVKLLPRLEGSHDRTDSFPLNSEDAEELAAFLKAHRRHALDARLEPVEAPAEPRKDSSQGHCHTLPDGAPEEHEGYLGEVPGDFLPTLARLNSRYPAERAEACDLVGSSRYEGALGYLVAQLDDEELVVRLAAAKALGRLRSKRAARALGRMCLEPEPEIVSASSEALRAIGVPTEEAIVMARGPRGPYGSEPTEPFTEADFRSHQTHRRRDAAWKRGASGGMPLFPALMAVDPESGVRRRGIQGLPPNEPGTARLLEPLLRDQDVSPYGLLQAVANLIPSVRLPHSVLVAALSSPSEDVARAALGALDSEGAIDEETLSTLLATGPPNNRRSALGIVARRRVSSLLPKVIGLLDVEELQESAIDAVLGVATEDEAISLLQGEWPRLSDRSRGHMLRRTAHINSTRVRALLLNSMSASDPEVRRISVEAVWKHHPNDSILTGELVALAARDEKVATTYCRELIAMGTPECEAALLAHLDVPGMRLACACLASGNVTLAAAARKGLGAFLLSQITHPDGTLKLPKEFSGTKWKWGGGR